MKDLLSSIKPAVRQVQAYTLKHFEARVKVNQNENPFDMPETIKRAVANSMSGRAWSRYPAFVPAELGARLARFANWKSDGILVGNGSNELIEAVLMVTVEPGRRVAIPQPTFTLYKMLTTILGGDSDEVCLTPELAFDVPRLVEAANHADVTILCSPNNPTGCNLNLNALREILKAATGMVVVDEAYHEFSRQSAVPLLEEFEHLVVLRTFSKAMAMAGLRVGYLLGHPLVVEQIAKAKLPYNLNIFSMTAAEAAVEHFALLQPQIELLIEERERLLGELQRTPGVTVYPSQANFIAFKTESPAAKVFDALYAGGVLVRDISRYPMLENFLRVSVGAPQENDQFLESLRKFLASRN
ncbi:MAG: histidinol-phosphate transaminase [Acidobacteria bacterium]|nr:histidinol-phosphate transaminase [Acidobacteriota bacterium]MCI0720663.1 histidinol-phosphate transaminase [Acidobacteriota bacterium]